MTGSDDDLNKLPVPEPFAKPPRIVRLPEVKTRTGLSRSTLYERMRDGLFPHTVGLGGRSVGWLESDVESWIKARVTETRL